MRYQRSYLIFFQQPDWPITLLACAVCMMVPGFGWGVLLGYLFEVMEHLQRQPGDSFPAFDMQRLGVYLRRGLAAALLHGAVWLSVLMVFILVLGTSLAPGTPPRSPGIGAKLLATGLSLAVLVFVLLGSLLLLPATFYLGLKREGGLPDALRFAQEFVKLVRVELLLVQVFVLTTGLTLLSLGVMLCGFGAPPGLALMAFAQYHLLGQLYELYLQRGGAAIPLEAAEPAATSA
ncbi:MAG: hypothetical protein JNM56_12450 [Planctomycetia bacterium]|nr:hypothetical protein [Planctomycetia bacterium]